MPFGNPSPPLSATTDTNIDGGTPTSTFSDIDGSLAGTTSFDEIIDGGVISG